MVGAQARPQGLRAHDGNVCVGRHTGREQPRPVSTPPSGPNAGHRRSEGTGSGSRSILPPGQSAVAKPHTLTQILGQAPERLWGSPLQAPSPRGSRRGTGRGARRRQPEREAMTPSGLSGTQARHSWTLGPQGAAPKHWSCPGHERRRPGPSASSGRRGGRGPQGRCFVIQSPAQTGAQGATLQCGQLPLNSSELSKARRRERLSLCHLGVRKRRTGGGCQAARLDRQPQPPGPRTGVH